jgi:histidine triad (HIT) family protein
MADCIFCKIVNGDVPSSKVYEDKDFLAFMDINPVNEGHVLIIPKKHSELISTTDAKLLEKFMAIAEKVGSAIRKSGIRCEGVNLLLADGEAAGQEVFHIHLHVIPRFRGDGFGFKFPAGHGKMAERKELDRIADVIGRQISS